ncbi:MAG TPA: hypothetical protein VGC39_04185 [Candidatus Methylacidiphilales bacterium]
MKYSIKQEETLARLTQTLDEYLDAVPRQKEPGAPDLLTLFERLDALEAELDTTYPSQLRHYMHQKSYRKAHLYLHDGSDEELRHDYK